MKAIVLHEYGPPKNLKYEVFDDPIAAAGEVLVRVQAAGVNPIDWKIRSGSKAKDFTTDFPAILGYDLAGVVREVGEGVEGFAAGDKVFARTEHCYAELAAVKATDLAKVPEGLELTTAGALAMIATTGDQLIRENGGVQPGQTILLTGALGSVGRIALYAAIEAGAKVIAGVRKNQIDEAKKLGAIEAIDVTDDAELARLGIVDVVADTLGGPLATKLLAHIRPGGTYASVVGPPKDAALHPTIHIKAFGSHPDVKATVHYAEAVRDKKLAFPIALMLPLADAAQAHTLGEKGGTGKIVLLA